jgi:hypothetical protein
VDGHASKAFELFVKDLQTEHGQDCKLEIQIFEAMRTAYFASVNLGIIAKDQRMMAVSKIEAMEHYIKKALNLVDRMIITHNMMEAGTGRRKDLAGAAAVAAAMAVQSDTWKQKLDKMMALHNVAAVAAVAAAVYSDKWMEKVVCGRCIFCKKFVRVAAAPVGVGGGDADSTRHAKRAKISQPVVGAGAGGASLDKLIHAVSSSKGPPDAVLAKLLNTREDCDARDAAAALQALSSAPDASKKAD